MHTRFWMAVLFLSAILEVNAGEAGKAAGPLTAPNAASLFKITHGKAANLKIADGKLMIAAAPQGMRIQLSDRLIPNGPFKLTAKLQFPDTKAGGHAGFLILRKDKKNFYVFAGPRGNYLGITGVAPKLKEKIFSAPAPASVLEIISADSTLSVSLNGKKCFTFDKLPGKNAGIAINVYKTGVTISEIKIEPIKTEAKEISSINLKDTAKAKKLFRCDHGRANCWNIADGKLKLSPGPNQGMRLLVDSKIVPTGSYMISFRISCPTPKAGGNAGVQVRRANGKSCYVHVSPDGRYIGMTGASSKIIEKGNLKPSENGTLVEIAVLEKGLDVRRDGTACFSVGDLQMPIGGIAFTAYKTDAVITDLSIVPLKKSSFTPLKGAIVSTDFARPLYFQRRLRLVGGNKNNYNLTTGKISFHRGRNFLAIGGTEGMTDFYLSSDLKVGKKGTAGFLVRRDCGKQINVVVGAENSSISVDSRKEPLPSNLKGKNIRLEIDCKGKNMNVSVNGKKYISIPNLSVREGEIAFASFDAEAEFYSISILDHTFFNTTLPID